MIRVRVSFDSKDEVREAKKVVRKLVRTLSKQYTVKVSKKIYWNLRDKREGRKTYGGRIYMSLEPISEG